ncbi:uncharacterized protein LOC129226785 [Uloborus diversus]|uniref:uncharacterized protein LOC129226785 n=1 Tax=Uloborus diversus TaxID=327109 RepID=UPI0024095F38|nr:uncharacterized protein LOC129226785 [Uloborus diversus]
MPRRKLTEEERLAAKKRHLEKCKLRNKSDKYREKDAERQRKKRSDPKSRERQNQLRRDRRERKRKSEDVGGDQPSTSSSENKKPRKDLSLIPHCSNVLELMEISDFDESSNENHSPLDSSSNAQPDLDLNDYQNHTEWMKKQTKFFESVSDGPVHRCYCCDRLWFMDSLRKLAKTDLIFKSFTNDQMKFIFYVDRGNDGYFCYTCVASFKLRKMPALSANYGFYYPKLPNCLRYLNDVEETLVAKRIPYYQIRVLGRDGQLGVVGSIVNVPIKWQKTITQLPRLPTESNICFVRVKKHMKLKSSYLEANIDKDRVIRAAKYLVQKPLYASESITFNESWLESLEGTDFPSADLSKTKEIEPDPEEDAEHLDPVDAIEEDNLEDDSDTDTEDDAKPPDADQPQSEEETDFEDEEDGLNPDPAETVIDGGFYKFDGLAIAPGQDQRPISLVFDEVGEELSFPRIYCGEMRKFSRPKQPSFAEISRSEVRRFDRRGATPKKVLYNHQKLLHEKLLSSISICLRTNALQKDGPITASSMQDPEFVRSLMYKNLAYTFTKNIKSSPAHWKNERARVFAMMRQYGLPTIFLTLSAAENRWYDLIKHLKKIHCNHDLTLEEFNEMRVKDKNDLIKKDPAICALYFDYKVKQLWKTFSCKQGPFGTLKVTHFFKRTEFQQRGSPHFHVLIWLGNAPQYKEDDVEEIESFVDTIMTCSKKSAFARNQTHHHTYTCKKKNQKSAKNDEDDFCRFNIPFFPMDRTRLLEPLEKEDPNYSKENHSKIRSYLEKLYHKTPSMSFQKFLKKLDLSRKDYIFAVRSGINRPTIMLKRNVDEILINNYNPKIMDLMQSNMDIQFILNGYAVGAYLVDYVNKANRGLSKSLRLCIEQTKEGNSSLRNKLKTVTNTFINTVEITAQEAAWSLLELPMSEMSEADIFIATFPPTQRSRVVKSQEHLRSMDLSSEDVFEKNILDRYANRPQCLEDLCLADFAAWYENARTGKADLKFLDGSGYVRRRRKAKIIRYRNYSKSVDETEYYREQLMLFTNWRDEQSEILDQNYKAVYENREEFIKNNRQKYVFKEGLEDELMEVYKSCEDDSENGSKEKDEELCPEVRLMDDEDEPDIERDMEAARGKDYAIFKSNLKCSEEEYQTMIRQCNKKQFHILKEISHHLRYEKEPLDMFIQGAAGTGKSFLINVLTETMIRIFEDVDEDPSLPTVLKTAPTGKAASNIGGVTLHSAFNLPFGGKLEELSDSKRNEYRTKYRNMKCLIIDEISMVSYGMYNCVDQRLRVIADQNIPFGGIHLLKFGDLRQLAPVHGSAIYLMPRTSNVIDHLGDNLWMRTKYYVLDEIMRQKDDKVYAELLNHLASGYLSEDEIKFLKSRETPFEEVPQTAVLLFHSNKSVDAANAQKLKNTFEFSMECAAVDVVTGCGSREAKLKTLEKAKRKKRTETSNLEKMLQLKVGIHYMLTYNLDTSDGLVNGAIGVLRFIETCRAKKYGPNGESDERAVKRIWLEFEENEKIGKFRREYYMKHMIERRINPKWTPIERVTKSIHRKGPLSVTRNQLPVIVSEAMTIHKSQGATFSEVCVGMKETMPRALQYVALSRVTKASGLYIVGKYNPPIPPSKNDHVFLELKRLQSQILEPKFQFLHERGDAYQYQVMYHNVRSLPKYQDVIRSDYCFMSSDLLLFVETRTIVSDHYEFPNFFLAAHVPNQLEVRKPTGICVYVNQRLRSQVRAPFVIADYQLGIHVAGITLSNDWCIAAIYAKPKAKAKNVLKALKSFVATYDDKKIVLLGDFNIEMDPVRGRERGKYFRELMERRCKLQLRTNPKEATTRKNTTIDAIFSSPDIEMRCGVYDSSYSDHVPLYANF